jgi:hypothetical protein
MAPQENSWICSVCTYTWCIQATGTNPTLSRESAMAIIGYPNCVNEMYGLMSSQCMINAFLEMNIVAREAWVTFDQAYAIAREYTGGISPSGMYHWMAIRGVTNDGQLWVANSARGYDGVYDTISRSQFNAYGPVKVIYLEQYASG